MLLRQAAGGDDLGYGGRATNGVGAKEHFKKHSLHGEIGRLAQRAAECAAATSGDALKIYNACRVGAGHINLTGVEPMRIIETGIKFRF